MGGTAQSSLEPALVDARDELVVEVARHRRHRFPARTESVRARYDRDELAVVAAAAARAGMTASGYVAATALAVASKTRPPDASGDRELLAELLQARLAVRRYAVNVNQGIAALHSGAGAPVWLQRAAAGCDRAVARVDELTSLLLQGRS
ncbi:MAG: hypothetical protein M3P91_06985 [Actinomycetota bacterium]|nr:hypothetical protein [Actinomycetota bacterium]